MQFQPQQWIREHILEVDARSLSMWRRGLLFAARLVLAVARDIADGRLTLQATSLVYTTLLSLVPLLAVSFSLLKAFGVHNQLEPFLSGFLDPLGEQSGEITARVVEFVENMRVGVLGALGLAILMYTVVSLLQKVEQAFNTTWRVTTQRGLIRRFSDYLSVLLVGPVLVFAALGVTATVLGSETVQRLSNLPTLGILIDLAAALMPYFFSIAAFTFVYLFVPNTKVYVVSALVGAAVAGVLWQTTGWLFAFFVAGSGKYEAIYSAFAGLIVFMLWLYLSWLILLIGASIAFYYQHPQRVLVLGNDLRLSARLRERVALGVMTLIGDAHYDRRQAPGASSLARELHVPVDAIVEVLGELRQAGLLRRVEESGVERHIPATPLEETLVAEVVEAVRRSAETVALRPDRTAMPPAVADLAAGLDGAPRQQLGEMTLRALVERHHPRAGAPARTAAQ